MATIKLPSWIKPDEIVSDCQSVEAFAYKYRKPHRFTARGDEYVKAVLETHRKEMFEKGWSNISHHCSITGKHVVFVEPTSTILWEEKQNAKPKDATT